MPAQMNVDPELLAASAAEVHSASEDFVAAHDGAVTMISRALTGWVGLSHAAMSDIATHWATSSVALAALMADHAQALAVSARAFAAMDIRHAADLAAVRVTKPAPCD